MDYDSLQGVAYSPPPHTSAAAWQAGLDSIERFFTSGSGSDSDADGGGVKVSLREQGVPAEPPQRPLPPSEGTETFGEEMVGGSGGEDFEAAVRRFDAQLAEAAKVSLGKGRGGVRAPGDDTAALGGGEKRERDEEEAESGPQRGPPEKKFRVGEEEEGLRGPNTRAPVRRSLARNEVANLGGGGGGETGGGNRTRARALAREPNPGAAAKSRHRRK
ncbi:hypothetical protein B0A50_02360 [Salinomyces thailandicus]|uniref:Uncharacterized protein n=1 Tax=Salinomyces thailandicus TaxID=706561 RepID=A0A4U0U644_9PEZI|nr:hypothetical protein B0A50_02360 [Salinomyces thailandica]